MRWLLCGDDGLKKTKTTSVLTEKYPARDFFHYSFILIRKNKSAPRQICNHFSADGTIWRTSLNFACSPTVINALAFSTAMQCLRASEILIELLSTSFCTTSPARFLSSSL